MPIPRMGGLKASDRTKEDQDAIRQYKGEKPSISPIAVDSTPAFSEDSSTSTTKILKYAVERVDTMNSKYQDALASTRKQYGVGDTLHDTRPNEYIDSIAKQVSSYYKKFKGTDKLPIDDHEYRELAAQYDAKKQVYGEDNANIWLNKQFKDIVGSNQKWWEQALNAFGQLPSDIEGSAIQLYGMLHGAVAHMVGAEGYEGNSDLGWWDRFLDSVIDNPITRYGRDVQLAGASNVVQGLENVLGISDETAGERIAAAKSSATKYNPEGLGSHAIVTTEEQDQGWLSSATPWQALQSGGFTAFSMLTGAAEAKLAQGTFNYLMKGANWLNKTGRIIKTEEALKKTVTGLRKAQNVTDMFIIPGAVGTTEGALEGLNTKIDVEREAVEQLDEFYKNKVKEEFEKRLNDEEYNPLVEVRTDQGKTLKRKYSPSELYRQVANEYLDEYNDARRQIDWAASKAGIHNFYANSLINGMLNQTLKAGIMAPRVQETLRNSRLFGWAYNNPLFDVGKDYTVTAKMGKLGTVLQLLKEPTGEGFEEYMQNITGETFSAAAKNNIAEFITRRFDPDGVVKVTDTFGSDYAASWTALTGALTSKESIESAILGAVSSSLGTVGGVGRSYYEDEEGHLRMNDRFSLQNFKRGLTERGERETLGEYVSRIAPWRSGLINAYYDRKKEIADAKETAANLTEWLKNPDNRAKWDGLVGTANWMTAMQNAAENNDQFNYRTAQMGKAINDVFMLTKLKGTEFYNSIMEDIQKASAGNISEEDLQKLRQGVDSELQGLNDEELAEHVQKNANKMLELMSSVEKEGKSIDRLMGRIDEDTKQSLIYGKLMKDNLQERKKTLEEEIDKFKGGLSSEASRGGASALDDDLKAIIAEHGSLNQALKTLSDLEKQKAKVEEKIEDLSKLDSSNLTEGQKEELKKNETLAKKLEASIDKLGALFEKDEKGRSTGEVKAGLHSLILTEQEIMDLDAVTRGVMLAQGANRRYNATHQNREKVDQLNLEISEIERQIEDTEENISKWTTSGGKVKRRHNKQVKNAKQKIENLKAEKAKKMRGLDAERGELNTKSIYSDAQQQIIDNLVEQGTAMDPDFLDKVVDLGRIEQTIKGLNKQYLDVLSDPKLFQNYVLKAKAISKRNILRRRIERISKLNSFEEYSKELDRFFSDISREDETSAIQLLNLLNNKAKREEVERKKKEASDSYAEEEESKEENKIEASETFFDRYKKNNKKIRELVTQFAKNPDLSSNDQSLLAYAMQYLNSKGIDVRDRDAAVEALVEEDEVGNVGGKFRQYVEERNSSIPQRQRAHMPYFTSVGQLVDQYVGLLEDADEDDKVNRTMHPEATPDDGTPAIAAAPAPENAESAQNGGEEDKPKGPSLTDIGYDSPDGGHIVDDDGNVATDAQTKEAQRQQAEQNQGEKSEFYKLFEKVTSPALAQMMEDVLGVIENSNASDEAKALARQYLEKIAVEGTETFSTVGELMDAVQGQLSTLKAMASQGENRNEVFEAGASLLKEVWKSLAVKKARGRGRRTVPNIPSSREENPEASWLSTANIPYLEQLDSESWPVTFTNDHDIDRFVERNWLSDSGFNSDTPVYFITNSQWTGEVTKSMTSKGLTYKTSVNMPIVAAVRVTEPENPEKTTAIKIGDDWYQPIAVMPSSTSKASGAARTSELRKLASKVDGIHLITSDGMPGGIPLTTRVFGVKGHHRDQSLGGRSNSPENNNDLYSLILSGSSKELWDKEQTATREEILDEKEYKNERVQVLNGLSWEKEFGSKQKPHEAIVYTPRSMKKGKNGEEEPGAKIELFRKEMSKTTDRKTGKRTLPEVLKDNNLDDIVGFNSITQGVYDNILRPIFQFMPFKDRDSSRAAKVITQEDVNNDPNIYNKEAERLSRLLNGYQGTAETSGLHGIGDYIYINPTSGWQFKVTVPSAHQVAGDSEETSETVYNITLVNTADPTLEPITLGTINAGQKDTDAAKEVLKNLLLDSETGQVRDFLMWQVSRSDIQNLNNKDTKKSDPARRRIARIIDDGIFEIPASSLRYDIDGLKLRNPLNGEGQPIYKETVGNPVNAQTSAPINITPEAEGAVLGSGGQPIEPDGGIVLGGESSGSNGSNGNSDSIIGKNSKKYKKAQEIAKKIEEDSKKFVLAEDETHYYVEDETTGAQKKFLRVTTMIAADESAEQFIPTTQQIVEKLKEKFSFEEPSAKDLRECKTSEELAKKLGVSTDNVLRAAAELRTEYKKEKFGAWGTPSHSVGNTADTITRDFFAGTLKDSYPNITKEALDIFVKQLELFKADLDEKGIYIVPNGVVAHGTITVTESNGNEREVNVAGTLDLFGYDENGNFYIFDMKTTHDHSDSKLQSEKAKWSRQISMYADLLQQTYGIEVSPENLRIIPINVDYPTPYGKKVSVNRFGKKSYLDPNGPVYSEITEGENKGQLMMTYGDGEPEAFTGANLNMRATTLKGQFRPGKMPSRIDWDNLSSEDQDIADALVAQALDDDGTSEGGTPETAEIGTSAPETPAFESSVVSSLAELASNVSSTPPQIVPAGARATLPTWDELNSIQKGYLADIFIEDEDSYNEALNDPVTRPSIAHEINCRNMKD